METRQVDTPKGKITYVLTRKRVKNINLHIRQKDGSVQVSAPYRTNVGVVDKFVATNSDFVFSALKRYNEVRDIKQSLLSKNEIFYLGKKYKVVVKTAYTDSVNVDSNQVIVYTNNTSPQSVQRLLEAWFDSERNRVFNEAFNRVYPIFELMGINRPELVFKSSISRWGYCQPKNALVMMNKALIAVPEPLIDYLVLHELTHLIYPDHSIEFWNFMAKFMPDCKKRRNLLQKYNFLL